MQMNVENNIRAVARDLSDAALRQLPFATSVALNDAAAEIQKNETKRLDQTIDRPTPFTKRAYGVRRSTKRRLDVTIYTKTAQARYLSILEEGGTRRPKGRALVIPAKTRRNKYGNMPRGAVKKMFADPKVFSGKPKGGNRPAGLYRRNARNKYLTKLVHYKPRAIYKPSLKFKRSTEKTAINRFPVHFERALSKAFATRRR